MTKLFVYGIFLSPYMQEVYGLTDPRYDTVIGYKTVGGHIVAATPDEKATLTGLVLTVPEANLPAIDKLENGYDRTTVVTTNGHHAYMYQK